MSLLRDSAIVGAATFLVGSVLMEINVKQEGEPVGWWPYAGTFIAGALGFYLLGATNVVKVKNAEDFEAMTEKEGIIVCDSCNTDVESDGQYGALTIECGSCGNTLYHDDSYDKFDMVDFYGAESYSADGEFDQYGRKIRKLVGNCPVCHGFFDVKPPNPEACNCDEDYDAESFSADQNEDLSGIKQFMAEVFEADRKARRRTTLTWARGIEPGFIGEDDFFKQPRPYENYTYYGGDYKKSNAYHISGLPTGYHIHLWKPRRRKSGWRVYMKSPNSKVWKESSSYSKSRIMPEVLKWYNDAIAAPTETELTPIQQLMIGQGMISGETQIHRIEIPATIQKKKNKITGEMVSKTIISGKIQYYYSGGEDDAEPTLFAENTNGDVEFEITESPEPIANFCRGLIYLDTETAGNLRSVNRYNKDRKQWVASHPAWFQNMCKQGINSVYFSSRRGTYSIEDNEFLRFYGTHSLPEIKTLDLGNDIEKPMFQVRLPIEDGEEVVDDGWITPRPSTQKKMYAINPLGLAETKIGIFNKCVAKYQPQKWDFIKEGMLEENILYNTDGFNLVGSEPAGHIMCRRFKKK